MNLKKISIVTGIIMAFLSPLVAAATMITVPSAPGSGYVLQSTTTGAYTPVFPSVIGVPTSTNPFMATYFVSTSTTATNVLNGFTTLGTTTSSVSNGTIIVNGFPYPQTSAGISQALSSCGKNGYGKIYLPAAIYTVNSRMVPVSNCYVYGAGKGGTILQGFVNSDWDFRYSSTTQLVNFGISDMTIDLQNGTAASGIQLSNASSTVIQRVAFVNGASSGWFILEGNSGSSATTTVSNFNNLIEDVDFINHTGTLEAMLIFNSENTQIIRPTETNISSPGIGLWQNDYDTHISDFYCSNSSNGQIYYSITVERTTIDSPNFNNCGNAIVGSNISDNGAFGLSEAQGLKITNPIIAGGANSAGKVGIQLGAVNDATVINPLIEGYQIGININTGNNSASSSPTNWSIIGGVIKNNNQTNDAQVLHPGILISSTTPSGLEEYGNIQNVQIYDDQASPTQKYPISFDGNAIYDGITISNNRLSAPFSLGGTSIVLADSASVGSSVQIYGNQDYSGTNPPQINIGGIWSLNGTTAYYSAGRVGVGTSTPDSGMQVDNFVGNSLLHVGDPFTNNSETKLLIDNKWTGAGGFGLLVERNSSTPQLSVDGTGFVGIGATTSPGTLLSVNGIANFTAATTTFYSSGGINISAGCFSVNSNCLSVSNIGGILPIANGGTATTTQVTNGVDYFNGTNISSGSTLTWNGSILGIGAGISNISAPLTFGARSSSVEEAIYEDATDVQGFGVGASEFRIFGGASGTNHISFGKYSKSGPIFTEQMRLDNSGNLGIGTTTPNSLLSVGNTNGINFSTATSTFYSTGGINLNSGCFSINNTCISNTAYTATYPLILSGNSFSIAFGTTTANSWSSLQTFTGGIFSNASSTIGGASQGAGLTVLGDATTTQFSYVSTAADQTSQGELWLGTLANSGASNYAVAISGGRGMIGYDTTLAQLILGGGSSKAIGFYVNGTNNSFLSGTESMFISAGNGHGNSGSVGIGTTTPFAQLQATNPLSNATTTIELGKSGQTKGTCIKMYDSTGVGWYLSITPAGALSVSSTACATVTGF